MKGLGDITLLQVKDLGLIEFMSLDFDKNENILRVVGPNDSGKSTILDSLKFALEGSGSIPDDVIRHGSEDGRAMVRVETSTGYQITRKIRTKDGKQIEELEVKLEGVPVRSAQTFLTSVCARFPDPQDLADLSGDALYQKLRLLIGPSIGDLESKITASKAEASIHRKKLNDLGKKDPPADLDLSTPALPLPEATNAYIEKKSDRDSLSSKISNSLTKLNAIKEDVAKDEEELRRIAEQIHGLQQLAVGIESGLGFKRQRVADGEKAIADANARLSAEVLPAFEKAEQEYIAAKAFAEGSAAATEYLTWKRAHDETAKLLEDAEAVVENHSIALRDLVNNFEFPNKDLKIKEGKVFLGDVTWDRASTSSRLLAAIELSAATIPDDGLRVMYLHRGESIGMEKRLELARFARERNIKILMEVMSEQPVNPEPGVVHIVGGEIRFGAATEPERREPEKPAGKAARVQATIDTDSPTVQPPAGASELELF